MDGDKPMTTQDARAQGLTELSKSLNHSITIEEINAYDFGFTAASRTVEPAAADVMCDGVYHYDPTPSPCGHEGKRCPLSEPAGDAVEAPKDGSAILLYPCGILGEVSADIGYWDCDEESEGGQCWRTLDGERIEPLPTLWMPIPKHSDSHWQKIVPPEVR